MRQSVRNQHQYFSCVTFNLRVLPAGGYDLAGPTTIKPPDISSFVCRSVICPAAKVSGNIQPEIWRISILDS